MLRLDLQWLLFSFLLTLTAAVSTAIWLQHRWYRKQHSRILPGPGELEPLLDWAPFGLLLLKGPRVCHYANPYARRLLELESAPCRLPDVAWAHHLNEDRVAARSAADASGCYRSVSLSSDRFIHWWVTLWGDLDLVFLLDMTAQRRAEQVARFLLSDLSHELRTPLATLLTHLEVLRLPHISEDTRQQSLYLMRLEGQRMARLIHELLELSRLETSTEIEHRVVDLVALAEGAVAQINHLAEEREIALSIQADTPLPRVIGDADRLKQVFLNLLDNAVKYSRPNDRVVVSLRQIPEGILCAICDSGPGIPAEHLPNVTRRFYRVAPQEDEGSGLGLALVDEILRRHQSRLEIESRTEGRETGTTVRFVLPALEVRQS